MEVSPNALQPALELADIQAIWPLTDFEYESLKADIKVHGIQTPILVYESAGELFIIAGFHRWKIARELGLATVPIEYYTGSDTIDARRQYSILENLARRQVTTETKKRLAKFYLKGNSRASDRTIGKIIGLDGKTIAQVRAELVGRAEIPHVDKRTDTRGRQQPAAKAQKTKPRRGDTVSPPRKVETPEPATFKSHVEKSEIKERLRHYLEIQRDPRAAAREIIEFINNTLKALK